MRLNGVATFIGIAGLTVAAAVLLVLLARQVQVYNYLNFIEIVIVI